MANLENSFLTRVPALMESGMDFETALRTAYEQDQFFALEMVDGRTERSLNAREVMKKKVYANAVVENLTRNLSK